MALDLDRVFNGGDMVRLSDNALGMLMAYGLRGPKPYVVKHRLPAEDEVQQMSEQTLKDTYKNAPYEYTVYVNLCLDNLGKPQIVWDYDKNFLSEGWTLLDQSEPVHLKDKTADGIATIPEQTPPTAPVDTTPTDTPPVATPPAQQADNPPAETTPPGMS